MEKDVQIHRKKVKNITLRVKNDQTIHLTVPYSVTEEYINQFLQTKREWIEAKLKYFEGRYQNVKAKEYVSGESFKYLGQSYILDVIKDTNQKVVLTDNNILLYVNDTKDKVLKQRLLENWYIDKAKVKFLELVNKYENILDKKVNGIKIKAMKTRWGSCNVKTRNINLNIELIKNLEECIEYVVLHELAHLKHPNHSKDFWEYVSYYMPDWKERKKKLEL